MTQEKLLLLAAIGSVILGLVAAALLQFLRGAEDQEFTRRIVALRQGAVLERRSSRLRSSLISLIRRLGDAVRDRLQSPHDAEVLARTMLTSGFEPTKAMPIFMGAKVACMLGLPAIVYLGTDFLGYHLGRQVIYSGMSLALGMMLPNWVMTMVRVPYQNALRRGIPDALDLLVVCAEAGLGLESAVDRVAQEMTKSNRPVGVEFSLLSYEMRILPDRRTALTNLAERSGQPALKSLAGTIGQTLKYGTPLSQGLRTLASELRNERMTMFEERAARLPALLVLPLTLFIVPCLLIVLIGQPINLLLASLASFTH